MLKKHEQELREIRLAHGLEKNTIETSFKTQLSQMQEKYQAEIASLKKANKERVDSLIKEYDSIVFGLQTEKAAELKQS